MKPSRWVALVAVLGLLVWGACDPGAANGTALFITVEWPGSPAIEQLRFSGVAEGAPAFTTTVLPEGANGVLNSGQTVRALMKDDVGGKNVDVSVDGLRANGNRIAMGSASVTAAKGREKDVTVTLTTNAGGGAGGGSGGGGAGGGSAGAGGGSGGGAATCSCSGGCCASGTTVCSRGNGVFFTCGAGATCDPGSTGSCGGNNSTCTSPSSGCDVLHSDRCLNGSCSCGTRGSPCPDNLTCYFGVCICSMYTCAGCCEGADGGCRALLGTTPTTCGNTGAQCNRCGDGGTTVGVTCTALGTCMGGNVRTCDAGQCGSGSTCQDLAHPRCGTALACLWCDPIRSDHCGTNGGCNCGAGGPCMLSETCFRMDAGVARCVPNLGN